MTRTTNLIILLVVFIKSSVRSSTNDVNEIIQKRVSCYLISQIPIGRLLDVLLSHKTQAFVLLNVTLFMLFPDEPPTIGISAA